MNGMFNMEELHGDFTYGIFDDFDWSKFTSYKQWLGAQEEFTVTDKYRKKKKFFWGKPCILLSNVLPIFENYDAAWVAMNCFIIDIQNKLFV